MKKVFGIVVFLFLFGSVAQAEEHQHGRDAAHGFAIFQDTNLFIAHYFGEYPHNGQLILEVDIIDKSGMPINFPNINQRVLWFDTDHSFSLDALAAGEMTELHTNAIGEDFSDGTWKNVYEGDVYIKVKRVVFVNMLDN